MKKKILLYLSLILLIIGCFFVYHTIMPKEYITKNTVAIAAEYDWNSVKAYTVNQTPIIADIDGVQLKSNTNGIFMSENMNLMIPIDQIRDAFDCAVNEYTTGILIEKGTNSLKLNFENNYCEVNQNLKELSEPIVNNSSDIFIPCDILYETFGYNYYFDIQLNQAIITTIDNTNKTIPYKYNYESVGRVPKVQNQGNLGTCWAFASLTALETTLLPKENIEFSMDHMSMNNSFSLGQDEGGDYTMAMAYLLAWQGPVYEADDPYGDGITTEGLTPVKHVQEIQLIEGKDFEKIKKMIFKYGGVQSSFYASVLDENTSSNKYYNEDTYAYCYIGTEKPNHDIVIIGWDDNYSKSNFNMDLEGDGAFICRNSWGSSFGDNGDFYISYYDTNIGVHNVAYTKVEDINNYDNIYQSDLCGYIGQLGYGQSDAYFANAYTANQDEELEAVGFYATGIDTEYSIYICENFMDTDSLSKRSDPVITGKFTNSGYYTVKLVNSVKLSAGQKYAVIVRISTPNTERPIAVEFASDEHTEGVILDDGEGYVSLKGTAWERTETTNYCNVCLKAYTKNIK